MEQVGSITMSVCTTLVVVEIIYFITPESKVIKCVYGLLYTSVIVAFILGIANMDKPVFETEEFKNIGEDYLNSVYVSEAEKNLCKEIKKSLATAGIECEDIEAILSINNSEEVTVEKISVKLKYLSDLERGKILIDSLFPEQDNIEVYADD